MIQLHNTISVILF